MNAATPPGGEPGRTGAEPAGPGRAGVAPAGAGPPGARPRRSWMRRHRLASTAAAALGIAVIVTVIILDRHPLGQSLSALGGLNFTWFALAIVAEVGSLVAFGLSRRRLLRADGHQARFSSVMAITYAGNALSMSIPFAGAQLAAVFSYQQFRRRGLDPAITGWALGVSAIASSSALALVLVMGAIAGGAPLATAVGFLAAAVFALPAVTVILALRYPRARALANRALAWLLGLVGRIRRKPLIDPAALEDFLTQLGSIRLNWRSYAEVFGLAVVNWLADCACLAFAIRATGSPVPWHGLLLAYGAGAVAGSTGVTPGGFLIVETALTAALAAAGMAQARALAAVLAYRLVNFWMILLGGGITLIFLRIRGSRARLFPPIGGKPRSGSDTDRAAQSADRPG